MNLLHRLRKRFYSDERWFDYLERCFEKEDEKQRRGESRPSIIFEESWDDMARRAHKSLSKIETNKAAPVERLEEHMVREEAIPGQRQCHDCGAWNSDRHLNIQWEARKEAEAPRFICNLCLEKGAEAAMRKKRHHRFSCNSCGTGIDEPVYMGPTLSPYLCEECREGSREEIEKKWDEGKEGPPTVISNAFAMELTNLGIINRERALGLLEFNHDT